ncbi:hypothetical protein F5Y01DRAFT_307939 [Xylaria sp. FL0043]|nr:hypothetical protein F5Y01DRAFT_307939 [Xylaria sp. FL0043]
MSSQLLTCRSLNGNKTYNISSDEFNCAAHFEKCECPPLQSNADVAGIGVVIAFLISASLTLLLTIIFLLLSRSYVDTWNPIDKVVRQKLGAPVQEWIGKERSQKWSYVLYDMVVCLSDQQLVTGIALLVAALKLLNDSTITVYHFSIAVDLAWFSANTHLLSLTVVRSFRNSAKPNLLNETQKPHEKSMERYPLVFRVVLMSALAVMLVYVSWIEGYIDWYHTFNCPAKCTISSTKGGESLRYAIANITFIIFDYTFNFITLLTPIRAYWAHRLRPRLIRDRSASGEPSQKTDHLTKKILLVCWYLYFSETINVFLQIIWHIIGHVELFGDRILGHILMSPEQIKEEDSLGFGQLVPIVLLALLILQLLETFAERMEDTASDGRSSNGVIYEVFIGIRL